MTDEMFHAATKIMANRAEQLGVSEDELMHKVNNTELLEKKERMLKQSRWERNRRKGNEHPRQVLEADPDMIAEIGKHGYIDTNTGRTQKNKYGMGFNNNYEFRDDTTTGYAKKITQDIDNYLNKYYDADEIYHRFAVLGQSKRDIIDHIVKQIEKNIPTFKDHKYNTIGNGYYQINDYVDEYVSDVMKKNGMEETKTSKSVKFKS